MNMHGPPRYPNGQFPPEVVPRVNTHLGKPQDGLSYQFGDPGPAIGTLESISSTFGTVAPNEEQCTFIGSEGVARATRQAMYMVRYADVAYVMVQPQNYILKQPHLSKFVWTFYDAYNRGLFQLEDQGLGLFFGMHAEMAFARYRIAGAKEAVARGEMRFHTGGNTYVHCSPDRVEVQQIGRRDVVPPQDLSVKMEDSGYELVLRAPQLHEARFLMGEVPNRGLMQLLLKSMGAKLG